MKRITLIAFLFAAAPMLCGCPYSSVYKLDDDPAIYVQDDLLGKWATFVKSPGTEKEEPVKMILAKKSDMEYNIAFIGFTRELKPFNVVSADSIKGSAFMSDVGGRQFLNISIKSQTYIAEIKLKDDKLSLLPLSEHFTAKLIRNNQTLRTAVDIHYKTRVHPMIEEDFMLKDMIRVN